MAQRLALFQPLYKVSAALQWPLYCKESSAPSQGPCKTLGDFVSEHCSSCMHGFYDDFTQFSHLALAFEDHVPFQEKKNQKSIM